VKNELAFKTAHGEAIKMNGTYALRERSEDYGRDNSEVAATWLAPNYGFGWNYEQVARDWLYSDKK
jgi:hypothetical protein